MLIDEYKALTSRNDFFIDHEQEKAILSFQELFDRLVGINSVSNSILGNIGLNFLSKRKSAANKGIYLYGGVGRGKTFIMDLFYKELPIKKKKRIHFHRFMNDIHSRLNENRNIVNPIDTIAKDISMDLEVLCFDEFVVNDIADAMILGELLKGLFRNNVTVVFTSNTEPKNLYSKGLQKEKFSYAIKLIEEYSEIIHIESTKDYRLLKFGNLITYRYPNDEQRDVNMQHYFSSISPDWFNWFTRKPVFEGTSIVINNRNVDVRFLSSNTIWFRFDVICGDGRSPSDYIEISKLYQNVFISDIPKMDKNFIDEARRFINLIDEFYDRNVKVIISAEVSIDELCDIARINNDFARTMSRLNEMQSDEYMSKEHKQ
jgi:cell division protein ZapE|tara:strand:+ start:764 stop:1885 length:1122 start_codon:yes stop_codon:yes gene_type:complete